jgi:hypothetical protein
MLVDCGTLIIIGIIVVIVILVINVIIKLFAWWIE